LVFQALEAGDQVAETLLKRCVQAFEKTLYAVYKKMGAKVCELTIFGGLTKQFAVIESFLCQDVREKCRFVFPKYPIVYGVMKNFLPLPNRAEFAENFQKSYKG
jgi:N-acetylglucosamine kinase-like BadF-type ATPase